MATIKDTRLFSVGMDKDSDERFMKQGYYREARNVRLMSMAGDETYDPEIGKIHSVDGHDDTDLRSVIDNGDQCIGAFKDEEDGLIYLFYKGNLATDNKIISFNEFTDTPLLLVENQYLAFNKRYPILDVYKFDDLLSWNDALNPPRKINVTRSYAGLDNLEFPQAVNVIQKPPLYAPTITVVTDTTYSGNNILDKFFQFRYRYIYADGEKSVFSPISEPAYSILDISHPNQVSTTTGMYNMISIKVLIDHADVTNALTDQFPTKVELAVRTGNNGDLFSVDILDCVGVDDIRFNFYNDGTYTPIPLNEAGQLMDDVPLMAGSQAVSNGRIIWGDVTRGFNDDVSLDVVHNVILRDLPSATTYTGTTSGRATLLTFAQFEIDLAAAPWSYPEYKAGDIFTIEGATGTDIAFGKVTITSKIGQTYEEIYNELIDTVVSNNPYLRLLDQDDDPIYGTFYNDTFTITITSGSETQQGFKSGEWYRAGIVYEDGWGRQQGIYSDPTMKFYIPSIAEREGITGSAVTNAGLCAMGFMINHDAPSWATRYKFAITPERVKPTSITLAVASRVVVDAASNLYDLDLATLDDYAENYDKTNITYSFTEGDRFRVIKNGSSGNWYGDIYDFEILKYHERIPDTTTWAHTKTTFHIRAHMPTITHTDLQGATIEIYSQSKTLEADQGIWYEIPGISYPIISLAHDGVIPQKRNRSDEYTSTTPDALIDDNALYKRVRFNYNNARLPSGLPSIGSGNLIISGLGTTDADWNATYDIIGYDVQESYIDILVVTGSMPSGTATTSLTGCITSYVVEDSPTVLTISSFNAYGRGVSMVDDYSAIDTYSHGIYQVESLYVNDFSPNSKVSFISRPAAILNVKGEKRDKATVIYTEPYIFNTEINGIGKVFPDVNFEEYNHKFGAITKLFTRDDGILMLQERKISKLLVGRDMIYNADGGGQMTTSSTFLSKQIPFNGEYGCKRPESFASFGDHQYCVDTINGTPIMITGDQIKEINDGMSKWFKGASRWVEEYNSVSARRMLVFGEYDGLYDEYVVCIKDMTGVRSTDILVFWMKSHTWISFMDYDPDFMFRSLDRIIVLYNEFLYRPTIDKPGLLPDLYRDSIIEVVSNINHTETKNYFAIDIDSNKAPSSVDIETLDGQVSSLISSDFIERDGHWQSSVLRDSNTPDISTPLLYGDIIKSKTAKFKFTFTNAPADGLKLSHVSLLVSKA